MRVAALGYYGFQNLGDEAVLAGIRQSLGEVVPAEFRVLTNDADATRRLHPGVGTVNRWEWRNVADALRGTDLFVFGGGSLLQDATSVKSVVWYCLMALLARKRVRRVVWWAQGIGPLNSSLSRRLVRLTANQADLLTVRDPGSVKLLKDLGVRGSIHLAADPAFALSPAPAPDTSAAPLLALRDWKFDGVGQVIGAMGANNFLDQIGRRTGSAFEAIPMHLPNDADYLTRILGGVGVYDWGAQGQTVEQVLGRFQAAPLVVGMRLHALIFAARCGVPFVALSYDPKVGALARASAQDDVQLSVDGITSEALFEAVTRVRQTLPARRVTLENFARERAEAARLPARLAAGLL